MNESVIRKLLTEGIESARAGDVDRAKELLEQVTELDETNEVAWMWLANLADEVDEKRVYLNTVLQLNPKHEQAQKMFNQLKAQQRGRSKMNFQLSQKDLIRYGGIAVGVYLVLMILFISVGNARRNGRAQEIAQLVAGQTEQAGTATQSAVESATALVQAFTATAETLALTATATPTNALSGVATLPPTFTPTPTEVVAVAEDTQLFPLPPVEVYGTILAWGGFDQLGIDYYPLHLFPLEEPGTSRQIAERPLVKSASFEEKTGQNLIYTRWYPEVLDFGVEISPISLVGSRQIRELFNTETDLLLLQQQEPNLSYDGTHAIFNANVADTNSRQLFLVRLDVPEGVPRLTRLTNDDKDYFWPAISPDNTRVVAVRRDTRVGGAEDLVIINIESKRQTAFTSDGAAFIESHPRWLPDGNRVGYTAAPGSADAPADIIIASVNANVPAIIPARNSDTDERYPVFSPNGRYMAYASDIANSTHNIFIWDFNTEEIYQLTNSMFDPFYPAGWYQDLPNE